MTAEDILQAVSEVTGIPVQTLKAEARSRFISVPRQLAYFLIRDLKGMSYCLIGRIMGKDHTTVRYGVKEIERLLESNEQIRVWHQKVLDRLSERRAA